MVAIFVALGIPLTWLLIANASARAGALIGLLILLGITAVVFEIVVCDIDLDGRTIVLEHIKPGRRARQEFSLDDIHTISVQTSSDSDSATHRVVFVLNSGDVLPLTGYSSSGRADKVKLAHDIVTYLNQVRSVSIHESLDGKIRLEQEGSTGGLSWKIAFIVWNDSLPQTRWQTSRPQLDQGFVLLMPTRGAKSGAMIPKGFFGAALRTIYGQYLRMLDVAESDLPGLATAQVLPGSQAGLGDHFTILTNDPSIAKSWLTAERVQQLAAWAKTNPLQASRAETDPHLVITNQGLRLTFRGRYNKPEQVAAITQLGAGLAN